jgi:hypothetical protein
MSVRKPRIRPVAPGESPPEIEEILSAPLGDTGKTLGELNLFRTMARDPELMRGWLPLGGHLLGAGSFPHVTGSC